MKRSASPIPERPAKTVKLSEEDVFEAEREIPLSKVNPSSSSTAFFKARLVMRRSANTSSDLTSLQLKSTEYPHEYTVDVEICLSLSKLCADDLTPGDWFAITLTDADFVPNPAAATTQLAWCLRYVGDWKIKIIRSYRRPDLVGSVVYGIDGEHILAISFDFVGDISA
jgi:hypothetical protein